MKNIKINEKLMTEIISGGLSLVLFASGFTLGKFETEREIKFQEAQIQEAQIQEAQIQETQIKQEKNEKLYSLKDMIVSELSFGDESNLFILQEYFNSDSYFEYRHVFDAKYNSESHKKHCSEECMLNYVHFDNFKPLIDYLTIDEIEKFNGKIKQSELDYILNNIRSEYNQKNKTK